jgi:hypothetical protein
MDFLGLEEDDGMSGARLFDLSDSDEFPDLHELVRGAGGAQGSLPSCNSDYSDSDMDAMVRDAHLEGITPTGAARTRNGSASGHVKSKLTPPSKRKRSIEVVEDLTTTQVTTASSPQIQGPHFRPQVRAQGYLASKF